MSHTEPLTAQEIVNEIRGRIRNIKASRASGMVNGELRNRLIVREVALQSVESWIVGQNQTREEEKFQERKFELYGNQEESAR